ncbi:MAG TPA: hypothetical protein VGD81_04370 [Opitutaceae bacterium]
MRIGYWSIHKGRDPGPPLRDETVDAPVVNPFHRPDVWANRTIFIDDPTRPPR